MKKRLLTLLLAAALALTLCTPVLASENTDPLGVYAVENLAAGYTLTPAGTAVDGFWAEPDSFTLTCPTPAAGEQLLVWMLSGESAVPTEDTLQYIDQKAAPDGTSFTLKPKALTAGTSYSIYVSTSSKAPVKAASFCYGNKPVQQLGDVDRNGKITPNDALLVLRHLVELTSLDETQRTLADVDGSGRISTIDAVYILRYAADLIQKFPAAQ